MGGFISRGFGGRQRVPEELADRVPPGQYVEPGFPGLTAGPTLEVSTADEWSRRGYTTNLAIEDLTDGKAWVITEHEGEPLPREHGGPARLLCGSKWLRRGGVPAGTRRGPRAGENPH